MGIDPSRGFVAFPRGLTDWEWYTEPNTARLFFHLLLTANYKEKQWKGITIRPGQLVTSRASLAKQLGMSEREVRTALKHLTATKYVTSQSGPKYTVVTINNYAGIICPDQVSDQQVTSKRPASDHNYTKITKKQENKSSPAAPEPPDGPTTSPLVQECEAAIGKLSAAGKAELTGYVGRLGEELVQHILRKCTDAGGHSWAYLWKALLEAETDGCCSVEDYQKAHPLCAGRNKLVDRPEPSGKDFLKDAAKRPRRLKKKEVPHVPES